MLPASAASGQGTGFWETGFTAMSALCITGLTVVDTGSHWPHLGQGVILVLIQIGGFGIMTLTSMLLVQLHGRVSHATARVAQTETQIQEGDHLIVSGARADVDRFAALN